MRPDESTVEEPVETTDEPVVEPITCVESVATVANYLKKIEIGSNNVTNVSFSNDGMWFSTIEKGSCIKVIITIDASVQ